MAKKVWQSLLDDSISIWIVEEADKIEILDQLQAIRYCGIKKLST